MDTVLRIANALFADVTRLGLIGTAYILATIIFFIALGFIGKIYWYFILMGWNLF